MVWQGTGENGAGLYGTISYNAETGQYTYTLNEAGKAARDELGADGKLTETFTYALTDKDGDAVPSGENKLTITITKEDNPVTLGDAVSGTVYEAGLSAGSGVGNTDVVASGAFEITALDGVKEIEVTLEGGFTATLNTKNNFSDTIAIGADTMLLTYVAGSGSDGKGALNYTYTLNDPATHPDPTSADSIFRKFAVRVTDGNGTEATQEEAITIDIVDDVPVAGPADVNATPWTVTPSFTRTFSLPGVYGADGKAATGAVTQVNADALQYGTFTDNGDGTFTYAVNMAGRRIKGGTAATETISYTITDADGDTVERVATIHLIGQQHTISYVEAASVKDVTVSEADIAAGTATASGKLTFRTYDDLGVVTINGIAVTDASGQPLAGVVVPYTEGGNTIGELIVKSVTPTGEDARFELVYEYTLKGPATHDQATHNATLPTTFNVVAKDQYGTDSCTATITVNIEDDAPTAAASSGAIVVGETMEIVGATDFSYGADGPAESSAIDLSHSIGDYGRLIIDPAGVWTYTLDGDKAAAIGAGEVKTEVFWYMIKDGDGDMASATVSITVAGPGAISGTSEDDILPGTPGNNVILGLAGNDRIAGGKGDDYLDGGAGDDELSGTQDNDTLRGGPGNDTLSGGPGKDVFLFADSLGPDNVDTITDFAPGTDKICLDSRVFTALEGRLTEKNIFRVASEDATPEGTDPYHLIIYNTTTGALYFDADGVGGEAAVQFATLDDKKELSAKDFAFAPES